jgi:hypothetical protein
MEGKIEPRRAAMRREWSIESLIGVSGAAFLGLRMGNGA